MPSFNEHVNEVREILNLKDESERWARSAKLLSFYANNHSAVMERVDPEVVDAVNFAFSTMVGLILTAYDDGKHSPENIMNLVQGCLGMCVSVVDKNQESRRLLMLTDRGLPKGVYPSRRNGGNPYRAAIWEGSKVKHVGHYSTPEEAEYRRLVALNGHHWVGIEEGPYFGFTYVITHRNTGKKYIGKKQFFLWNGPTAGYKCHDMESEWWDEKAWKPNNWKLYTGSSKVLEREMATGNIWDYTYEVLDMCRDALDLHLSELRHQIANNVLEAVDDDGNYLYYNENIAGLEYRPPFRKSEVKDALKISEEAMRNYYLKPDHCHVCGKVIPYGLSCCTVSRDTGGFNDLTT